MSQLQDLLARVEAAEGPNAELDGRVWCAALGYEFVRIEPWSIGHKVGYIGGPNGWYYTHPTEPLTRSLDAALALVERVLPVDTWDAGSDDDHEGRYFYAALWSGNYDGGEEARHRVSAPLALLAALLKALIAEAA